MSAGELPKVLIVDDKTENLIVLEKLLATLPIKIIKAQSGNDALALMLEHEFVLILLDVQMPVMNGYEVLEVMSWDDKTRYIPVIFITANYADEQHKLRGYQYGAVDYLYKPIDDVVLLSKVKVFLELYEQRVKYQELLQHFQLILKSAGEGIFGSNTEGMITFVNPAAEKILGYSSELLINHPLSTILSPTNIEVAVDKSTPPQEWHESDIYEACKNGRVFHKDDTLFVKQDKSTLPVEFTAAPLHDEHKQYNGIVFVFSDITLRKTIEEQLTNLALYDHLTKLPNRLLFEKTINQSLARARRNNKQMALMFLDLDHFKNINDSLGHDIGDSLLKGVADRLIGCVRETDTVARLGGDEFAVILDEISVLEDAAIIAQKIITSLQPAFYLNSNEVFVSTSIGIAVYPVSGDTSVVLSKNADIAMYQAKQTGRNNFCFFTDVMNEQVHLKLEMVHSLRYAVERNELELYYQPKISLTTNKIIGVEALIRWNHPSLGLLLPTDFLQTAEETGLIHPLGRWVIEKACAMLLEWNKITSTPLTIAINLSIGQLMQNDIISVMKSILDKNKLPAKMVEVEVTETSLMTNTEKTKTVINQLHALGLKIAIDDFGTGYSSLNYLKQLSVDALKIDKTFVNDLTSEVNDADIVKAIIGLAHNLNLQVIAEGVESQEQLDFLRDNNCDVVQGYFLSVPLDANDLIEFIKKNLG